MGRLKTIFIFLGLTCFILISYAALKCRYPQHSKETGFKVENLPTTDHNHGNHGHMRRGTLIHVNNTGILVTDNPITDNLNTTDTSDTDLCRLLLDWTKAEDKTSLEGVSFYYFYVYTY